MLIPRVFPSFLEAAESFQIRTRTACRHEGVNGRDESDSQYFKRIRREQKAHNVTASELREAAAEYIKFVPVTSNPLLLFYSKCSEKTEVILSIIR
ncbi:hypothetical protein EO98_18455 [Methanosarcina sp. 2.H.T.1A.6]|uniref:hypothetical protein n=1 Tax=unclassified Methanosarcina TaxID=2644672 RepID=UPI0006216EF0|nr:MULTISPECIES: hypothetical protein [unclassified Methanosarcina]KKG17065.1 hypothetical protein EO94_18440 [Methanosarcina sp. 2.H.T.1A.3]KKG20312.1 hypothetical protein EO98_18455 [Methanosarcina sp. 2.H.T.1A.6]KKG21131.1 hypothetical protein EO97_00690 [Methanosarcina sp. 2.H.T.1A.15]KKG23424.1 hypothetical protein EO96_17405 [Methanosarcina sp. 2.H.T.1A.8]